jgi:hypothetical protein
MALFGSAFANTQIIYSTAGSGRISALFTREINPRPAGGFHATATIEGNHVGRQ